MTKEQKEELKKYVAFPVRCDKYGMYIWDSDHHMLADTVSGEGVINIRGWGRLQKLGNDEGARVQKLIGDAFAEALNTLVTND